MISLCLSACFVTSTVDNRRGQFTTPKDQWSEGHISVMVAWSVRVTVRVIGLGLGTSDHSDQWPFGLVTCKLPVTRQAVIDLFDSLWSENSGTVAVAMSWRILPSIFSWSAREFDEPNRLRGLRSADSHFRMSFFTSHATKCIHRTYVRRRHAAVQSISYKHCNQRSAGALSRAFQTPIQDFAVWEITGWLVATWRFCKNMSGCNTERRKLVTMHLHPQRSVNYNMNATLSAA